MEDVQTALPDAHVDKLDEVAENEGQSRSNLVREIVQQWLRDNGYMAEIRGTTNGGK